MSETVAEGGNVSPGSSFGILHIGEGDKEVDYYQGKDAELVIEVRAADNPQPGEDYDQLVVTGTAYFEDGTTLRLMPAPGVYRTGMSYTIVEGDVVFDPTKINVAIGEKGSLLFLAAQAEEGSIKVVLGTKPFEGAAETGNQAAVASVLTAVKDEPGTELDDLYAWLFTLAPGDEAKAQAALDRLSGEVYTALPTLAARRLDAIVAGVEHGLAQGAEPGRRFWAAAQGSSGRIRGNDRQGTAASDIELRGLTVGADLLARGNARAGLLAGFLSETLTMDARQSAVRGSSVHLGGYGQWELDKVTLRGVVGFSSARSDSERRVAFGGTVRTAQGAFETSDTVMAVEARFAAWSSEQVRLVPVVGLAHYTTRRAGFRETGAGNEGLTVQAYDAAWVRGLLGLELGSTEPTGNDMSWYGRWRGCTTSAQRSGRRRRGSTVRRAGTSS
ncbi:MAG TPA: autotransporter outer membrane beta-barrel domain-containing protein [Limnochordales bacterium]|nr:autotransporter outer membrane beta-barrel domain-containing protein [Limnochordales bacterium]